MPLLEGVPAAPGQALGPAWLRATPNGDVPGAGSAEDESARVERLLVAVADDLGGLAERLRSDGMDAQADIVATGAAIAADPELLGEARRRALEPGVPAVVAVDGAANAMAEMLEALDQEHLRERASDVRAVARRARELASPRPDAPLPERPSVLIADDLGPAEVVRLDPGIVLGIALSAGGATSHAAIVARALGVPLVVGAGDGLLAVADGQQVLVDGDRGRVVVDPDPEETAEARRRIGAAEEERRRAADDRGPATTADGRRLLLHCNAASEAEVVAGLEAGADGVGLLRTELHFLDAGAWPTRAQHEAALEPILRHLHGRPATVRVLDFGGDKAPPFLRETAATPLAARGVRLLLTEPAALAAQLEAIVETSRGVDLRIMVPMVGGPDDLRHVRDALRAAVGHAPIPKLGAMIEVPAAAITADTIVEESDFLSIGSNDLVQYTLAADRQDPRHADVAVFHNPAVLRLVAGTIRAAHARGRQVTICGEAAAEPLALPLLVGMGVDGLSVGANSVTDVRARLRRIDSARAGRLAADALDLRSAGAVAALIRPIARQTAGP
jgi:phosphoenolpyruvate-protein phosphotransferase